LGLLGLLERKRRERREGEVERMEIMGRMETLHILEDDKYNRVKYIVNIYIIIYRRN